MKKNLNQPVRVRIVSTTIDGQEYRGTYSVEDGVITVRWIGKNANIKEKSTSIGNIKSEVLANILLSEMVQSSIREE